MTTPTPDEQALTEQIAEVMYAATPIQVLYAHGAEDIPWADLDDEDREDFLIRARAVLPVVKAAQRDALTRAADFWAADPDHWRFETDADTRNWLRDGAPEEDS